MFVSTSRYSQKAARGLAIALASAAGSVYAARGKKSIERLVSEARRKGENTIALVSEKSISFISVSASGWNWKKEIVRITGYVIKTEDGEGGGEAGAFEGKDGPVFQNLFGADGFHTGGISIRAERGKLEFTDEEGKQLLEINYEVATNEEPRSD